MSCDTQNVNLIPFTKLNRAKPIRAFSARGLSVVYSYEVRVKSDTMLVITVYHEAPPTEGQEITIYDEFAFTIDHFTHYSRSLHGPCINRY